MDARRFVEGTVRLAQGGPAAEATVILGRFKTQSESDGRFLLKLDDGFIHPSTPLVGLHAGFQAAVIENFGAYLRPKEPPPDPASLVLGGPALSIQGRLVDEAGSGLEGWTVRLQNGLVLEQGVRPAPLLEHLIAGADFVLTSADGSFALAGLMPRSYIIEAVKEQPLVQIISDPIPAGRSDVLLRLDSSALASRVHGRVVDWNNRPISSVLVTPRLVLESSSGSEKSVHSGVGVTTDEAGRFELRDVGTLGLVLVVTGEAVMTSEHPIASKQVLEEQVLTAARRAHFQVHLVNKDLEPPLTMLLFDPSGKQESICRFTLNRWSFMQSVTLAERQSSVYTAGEGNHTLVLQRESKEILRQPILLVPGEVQTVELR